jgi:hypothetical protein
MTLPQVIEKLSGTIHFPHLFFFILNFSTDLGNVIKNTVSLKKGGLDHNIFLLA